MNYCINAAWHGGTQPVALLRCNGSPGCFDGGLQVICIVGSGVSHLPLDNTPYILYGVQVRRVCWPIKHSNTMLIEPAFGTFGSVGRCQFLLENEISISTKLVSRRKHDVLKNFLVDAVLTVDFRKHSGPTPADVMAAQIITDCGNFTLDFKQHGFCASPLFLQTLGPWFSNEIQNLLSSEKRTLDHWATVQFFFSLAQVKCFWQCFCFRNGLVVLFLKMSERGDSWCSNSSFSSLLVKLSQVFESALRDRILKLAVIPVAFAHFPTQFLSSSQLCI